MTGNKSETRKQLESDAARRAQAGGCARCGKRQDRVLGFQRRAAGGLELVCLDGCGGPDAPAFFVRDPRRTPAPRKRGRPRRLSVGAFELFLFEAMGHHEPGASLATLRATVNERLAGRRRKPLSERTFRTYVGQIIRRRLDPAALTG